MGGYIGMFDEVTVMKEIAECFTEVMMIQVSTNLHVGLHCDASFVPYQKGKKKKKKKIATFPCPTTMQAPLQSWRLGMNPFKDPLEADIFLSWKIILSTR